MKHRGEPSTSIQSICSNRFRRFEPPTIRVESTSLQRSIQKQQLSSARVARIGISTAEPIQIPKSTSYYDRVRHCHNNRIYKASQLPQYEQAFMNSCRNQPKGLTELKRYVNDPQLIESVASKFFVRKGTTPQGRISVPQLLEKLNRTIHNQHNDSQKIVIKKLVQNRIPAPIKFDEPNYQLDSLFQNYKTFSQQYLNENQVTEGPKQFNVYQKLYTSSMKDSMFITLKEKEDTASDDSLAYQQFLNEVDMEDIQRDVYHANIRNPFLEDKVTVRTMKMAGFLKRRTTQI